MDFFFFFLLRVVFWHSFIHLIGTLILAWGEEGSLSDTSASASAS